MGDSYEKSSTPDTGPTLIWLEANDTTLGLLYNGGGGGGIFDVTLGFSDTTSVTVTLDAAFWLAINGDSPAAPEPGVALQENLGAYYGHEDNDNGQPGIGLLVHEAHITRGSLLKGLGFDM